MDRTLRPTLVQRIAGAPYARLGGSVARWIDDSPMVVRLALLFFAVLIVVAAFPAHPTTRIVLDREVVTTPAPFAACGIDLSFNPVTGHCAAAKPVPRPCVQSTHGCMATTASVPTAKPEPAAAPVAQRPADPFAGIMGITKDH